MTGFPNCRWRGLGVLEPSQFTGSRRKDYWVHKNGGMTHRDILEQDMEQVMKSAIDWSSILSQLRILGYQVDADSDFTRISVRAPGWQRAVRMDSVGYTYRILQNRMRKNWKRNYVRSAVTRAKYSPLLAMEKQMQYEITHAKDAAVVLVDVLFYMLLQLLLLTKDPQSQTLGNRPHAPQIREAFSMDRDAAIIAMVDSNLHREHILPSEKAFAYKMKMEALSHQGKRTDLTSGQVGPKLRTDEQLAQETNDSARQIKRYIRLTNLIPGILQMVDTGEIALTPGETLSYLTKREQEDLLETMDSEGCTPSLSQAQQLKQLSQAGQLSMDMIFEVLSRQKQKEKIKIDYETVRKYFPASYSPRDVQTAILKLVEQDFCRRQKQRDAR